MKYQYTNLPPLLFSPSRREGGDGEGVNEKIYDKAIKFLAMRLHTTGELRQKLELRGFKSGEIRLVLKKLEEQKFLDDARFAEIFVDNLKRYKDFGYYGVKAKLMERFIPSDIAESALRDYLSPDDELIVARRLIGKLRRQGRTEQEKLMRSMQSRGFRSEVTRKALGHLS